MNNFKTQLDALKNLIVGKYYTEIRIDCGWAFHFDNQVWLLAQQIEFPETHGINENLKNCSSPVIDEIDSEDMAKAVMALKNRQNCVVDVCILKHEELLIKYGNGNKMRVKTDTDIVDWQWAFSNTDTSPYQDTLVACFYPGEIEMQKNANK